jgi:hypothetical protein
MEEKEKGRKGDIRSWSATTKNNNQPIHRDTTRYLPFGVKKVIFGDRKHVQIQEAQTRVSDRIEYKKKTRQQRTTSTIFYRICEFKKKVM